MSFDRMTFFDKMKYIWEMDKDWSAGPGMLLALCAAGLVLLTIFALCEKKLLP